MIFNVLCNKCFIFVVVGMWGLWILYILGLILFGYLKFVNVVNNFIFECEVLMVIMFVFNVVIVGKMLLNLE